MQPENVRPAKFKVHSIIYKNGEFLSLMEFRITVLQGYR